ncbi:MAG: hypothetical protein NTZ98_24320 [Acidobacteria bacterium]|nr:hypothetical protein [Acidobacteriota bacterium]
MFTRRAITIFTTLIVSLVFATAAFALAATNTVPDTTAGDGSGAISGYTISNVTYALNASNPSNVDSVSFTIVPTTGVVKVQLNGSTWYNCTNTAGSVSCTTTGLTALAATSLRVVAAQ